jgi:hypothetical protein
VALAIALAGLCLAGPARAQGKIPEDARGFMKWCAERGFTAKDTAGWSCSFTIGMSVAFGVDMAVDIDNDRACKAIQMKDLAAYEKRFAKPIYDWLRSHPDRVRGTIGQSIEVAVEALYRCRAGM